MNGSLYLDSDQSCIRLLIGVGSCSHVLMAETIQTGELNNYLIPIPGSVSVSLLEVAGEVCPSLKVSVVVGQDNVAGRVETMESLLATVLCTTCLVLDVSIWCSSYIVAT